MPFWVAWQKISVSYSGYQLSSSLSVSEVHILLSCYYLKQMLSYQNKHQDFTSFVYRIQNLVSSPVQVFTGAGGGGLDCIPSRWERTTVVVQVFKS